MLLILVLLLIYNTSLYAMEKVEDRTFNIKTQVPVKQITDDDKESMQIAFNEDGSIIANTNSNNTISLWNVSTQQKIAVIDKTYDDQTQLINKIHFEKDNILLFTDKNIYIYDIDTKKRLLQFDLPTACRPIPDEIFITTNHFIFLEDDIIILDRTSGKYIETIKDCNNCTVDPNKKSITYTTQPYSYNNSFYTNIVRHNLDNKAVQTSKIDGIYGTLSWSNSAEKLVITSKTENFLNVINRNDLTATIATFKKYHIPTEGSLDISFAPKGQTLVHNTLNALDIYDEQFSKIISLPHRGCSYAWRPNSEELAVCAFKPTSLISNAHQLLLYDIAALKEQRPKAINSIKE